MATRGLVGKKVGRGFIGVYNHWDSYPSGLGFEVLDEIQKWESLEKFVEELLRYDDWRNFLRGGKCEYCGKRGVGQAHTINGKIFGWREVKDLDEEIKKNIEKFGVPDPKCKYHKHGSLDKKLTEKNTDALWIEWAYLVDVENKKLEILSSEKVRGKYRLVKKGEIDLSEINEVSYKKLVDIEKEVYGEF